MKKVIFTILTNEKLTDSVYKMTLAGDTSGIARSGQFVNIQLDGLYLRRPISVCDYEDGKLTLIYKVVGKGTEQMSWLDAGTKLDILVGLGNGYFLNSVERVVRLVGSCEKCGELFYNILRRKGMIAVGFFHEEFEDV